MARPSSARLTGLLRRLRGASPATAAGWDASYAAGRWDYLASLPQLAHYMIIVGYIFQAGEHQRVLDIGCGDGRLAELLGAGELGRYVGIDISPVAIERAKGRDLRGVSFEVADYEKWAPPETFDVVVFNETLYYAARPVEAVQRALTWTADRGVVVISMWRHRAAERVWRRLDQEPSIVLIDATTVENVEHRQWDVKAFRRRPGPAKTPSS